MYFNEYLSWQHPCDDHKVIISLLLSLCIKRYNDSNYTPHQCALKYNDNNYTHHQYRTTIYI